MLKIQPCCDRSVFTSAPAGRRDTLSARTGRYLKAYGVLEAKKICLNAALKKRNFQLWTFLTNPPSGIVLFYFAQRVSANTAVATPEVLTSTIWSAAGNPLTKTKAPQLSAKNESEHAPEKDPLIFDVVFT